jgi:hypothetical protein
MATHMLVVGNPKQFQMVAEEMGLNGEGQEKAVCLFADGSNIHHAFGYRPPLIIHMIVPTIDCRHIVQRAVQDLEQHGAEVRV